MMCVFPAFLNPLRFFSHFIKDYFMSSYNESPEQIAKATEGYVMQQTMLRIKDPKPSLAFYENVLGMKLLGKYDFPGMEFTLYFLGYEQDMPKGAFAVALGVVYVGLPEDTVPNFLARIVATASGMADIGANEA